MTTGEPSPPGVPGPVVPLPGRTTHVEIGDITGGPIPVEEWRAAAPGLKRLFLSAWIRKACEAEQVDPAIWGPPYLQLISRESGLGGEGIGDPNIVNLWDENAKAGIPSIGLAQVIQSNAPGENLLDPVVNLRASIRHIKGTYGDIRNVQQADPSRKPKGYAKGGPPDGLTLNERLLAGARHYDTGGPVEPGYPFPMFTDEGPQYADAAYAHNRPFATGAPYQTPLSPEEEQAFRQWVAANRIPADIDNPRSDYDMRGYWKEHRPTGRPAFYNDTYKTPYDTTFSQQSKYATPDCPFRWYDGATLIDVRTGKVIFFNPSHYASEDPKPMETAPFAPPDVPGRQTGGPVHFDDGGDLIHPVTPGVNPSQGRDVDPWRGGGFRRTPLGVMHPEWGEDIVAPWDRAQSTGFGSGYGTRWHAEVVHASGHTSQLPLRQVSTSAGQSHWTSDYQLQPGENIRIVSHGGTMSHG